MEHSYLYQSSGSNMIYFTITYSFCIMFIQPFFFFPHSPFMLKVQGQGHLSSAANALQ